MAGAPLFRGVSFKLERGDRMTLAGRNGAGKTTLLRIVAGQSDVDGGELAFEKGTRTALHDQRPPRERGLTLRDYVLAGCSDLVALEQRLRDLEDEMAARPDDEGVLRRYASTQTRLEHAGGWNWRTRALAPLHGLGFADAQLDRPLESFSGGELTRASLARALAGDPDLLLLDEPTNHLDISSLEWLEGYLTTLDAAVILVAHDRWFLEAVGTSVLELEAGKGRFFPGSWHAWRRELAAREIALGKAIEKQQREIERMERFVERFRYKATKARQAQSRVKRLEKMERIERDPTDTRSLGFSFGTAERTGRVALEIEDARLEVPGRTLLEDGELWLERGEHISVIGPNGAGKTTLIEALAGRRPLDGGRLRSGHNVNIGYLSQHGGELGTRGTALEAVQRATGLTPNKARALLGRFLFSGEEAEKPMEGLSGGERRRLSLAVLVSSGANVLILDEPTNHLDLDAREALEDALQAFGGSVLLVSHDRALLDAVGSRTVAFEEGRLRSYEGGWAEYARVREERREAAAAAERDSEAGAPPRRAGRAAEERSGVWTARGSEAVRQRGVAAAAKWRVAEGAERRGAAAQRSLEERAAPARRARARGRARGDRAAAARGRAGRPGDVEQPFAHRAQHGAARGCEACGRAGLRALGGGDALEPEVVRVMVAVLLAALLDVRDVGTRLRERHVVGGVEAVGPAGPLDPAVNVGLAGVVGSDRGRFVPAVVVDQVAQEPGPVGDVDLGRGEIRLRELHAARPPRDEVRGLGRDLHQSARPRGGCLVAEARLLVDHRGDQRRVEVLVGGLLADDVVVAQRKGELSHGVAQRAHTRDDRGHAAAQHDRRDQRGQAAAFDLGTGRAP